MKLSIDWAVDDPGLEAKVGVAKLYRGCHHGRVWADRLWTDHQHDLGPEPDGLVHNTQPHQCSVHPSIRSNGAATTRLISYCMSNNLD
jgi:hypothetical protein